MRMVEQNAYEKPIGQTGVQPTAERHQRDDRKARNDLDKGPNGCDKATAPNCLLGLDDITDGTIEIEGVPLEGMRDRDRTRHRAQRMGFIFEPFNLLPVLTAVERKPLYRTRARTKLRRERYTLREALLFCVYDHNQRGELAR